MHCIHFAVRFANGNMKPPKPKKWCPQATDAASCNRHQTFSTNVLLPLLLLLLLLLFTRETARPFLMFRCAACTRHHTRPPDAIQVDQSRQAEGGMDANKAGGNRSSLSAAGSDDTISTDAHVISRGISSGGEHNERRRPGDGLRIDVQLAEETGRKLGPAVLVTGGIGRHGGSQGVATTPCASKPPPDMLAAATDRPATAAAAAAAAAPAAAAPAAAATNNDIGDVNRRADFVAGGGSRVQRTYPNAKKLSTLAAALATGRLDRSSSCSPPPPVLPTGSPSGGQSGSSGRVTVQQNLMVERSGSGPSRPGEHDKVEEERAGVASSSPRGEETGGGGAGGMKRRRSYDRIDENEASSAQDYSDSDVEVSGEGAPFGYNKGINMFDAPAPAAAAARVRPRPKATEESAAACVRKPDEKSLQTSEGHGQSLVPSTNSRHTALASRPGLKTMKDIVSEAMAMAAAAAAVAAAGAPASPRTANNGRGGVVQVYHRVTSGGSSQCGLDRAQQEYSRIVAEAAAATPNTAAPAVAAASADYNHRLGWAQHAFLRAEQEYAGVRRVCGTVEDQWEEANRRLQAAARAVAAPSADLNETYRQYIHAENCFRTGEALVNSAEAQEARAKRELTRATEALEVAGRAVVRAEVTLCDFDRSYFSPVGGRVENRASAGPGVQIKPGDGLARQEEGREMKQESARGPRSHASVPPSQDFVLPAAVGTKSWKALHGAQPAHAGEQGGGGAEAMDVDGEDFKQLAQVLLEGSQRGEDEPLQNCDAGAAAKARMPMSVGTACEHKCEEPSRGGEGGAVPATRESETKLDKTKYLGRLADTLQNARQIWREATAQKNRAHIEVDQAVLLVGARTLGDLSFAAKRRSSAARLYQKARAEAAPVLKAVVEQAKAFEHADNLRAIARGNLNLAWEARELARVRPQPTTAALFAAAAAVAAASAAESISPTPSHDHGAARRMNTFHAGEVARTAVGGAQHAVSAARSTEQASWRGGAPGQALRSPRGG